jgi:hypothetical protein
MPKLQAAVLADADAGGLDAGKLIIAVASRTATPATVP